MFYILFNFFLLKRLGGFKKVPHKVWEYEIFSFRTRKHCACSTWAGCLGKRCSRYSRTKHVQSPPSFMTQFSRAGWWPLTTARAEHAHIHQRLMYQDWGSPITPMYIDHWYSKNLLWYSRLSMVLLRGGFRILSNYSACQWGFCLPISGEDAILNACV